MGEVGPVLNADKSLRPTGPDMKRRSPRLAAATTANEPDQAVVALMDLPHELLVLVAPCADAYVPGPPYCTYGARVLTTGVAYVS